MSTATLDVDPDVYRSVGGTFLDVNDAVCDIVAAAAESANLGHGMAGVDSTGAAWAGDYDAAAAGLLRVGAAVVDALGVLGDRLVVSGGNHEEADTSSIPRGAGGPPAYPGSPGTGRAVAVVVSDPPSADGTPTDPPPGWWLIAHLIAWTWPAGHPEQLRAVGSGWLSASLNLSDQADRLSRPIAELAGQTSPEVPYALETCAGVQTAVRTVADQCAAVAHVCTAYANHLAQAHQDVIEELVDLVASEAVIEIVGAIASMPTAGAAEVPAQAVAGSRLTLAALRVGKILIDLARDVVALRSIVEGVAEHVLGVLVALRQVAEQRDTLQAVTALIDAGIPPIDLQANDAANPSAHVIEKHVAKSDAYLVGRSDKRIASTFTSLAAATTAVSTLIAASPQKIRTWLAGSRPTFFLEGPLPVGAGRSYLRDSGVFVQSTRIAIRLKRNSHGYFIVTAYPEP